MLDIIRILQIIKKYKVKIILCDSPSFPDARQHFRCYPAFKAFCRFKFAAEDERVEAGFVDDSHFLDSCRTPTLKRGECFILFINMSRNSIFSFRISQRRCYIFSYEPWLSINLNAAQISKFWMIEDLALGSGRRRGHESLPHHL